MTKKNGVIPKELKKSIPAFVKPKEWIEYDIAELPTNVAKEALKRLKKLKTIPRGVPLTGILAGSYAVHFHNNCYRIVFDIDEEKQGVIVWGIGKKDKGYIYNLVEKRKIKESASP